MPKYEIHPYCAAFPDMDGKEFDELVEHLKHHGQQEPIWTYKGSIIDGKNRLRALVQIRREPNYQEWKPLRSDEKGIDGEMRQFVIAKNVMRRNLSTSKRAMIAARISNAERGGDRDFDSALMRNGSEVTTETAAEQLDVSTRSVENAKAVINNAEPEVVAAVDAGEVTVTDAAHVATLPAKEQVAAVKKVRSGKAKTLTAAAKKPPKKKAETREPGEDPVEPAHDTSKNPCDCDGVPIPDHLREVYATHDLFRSADKALAIVTGNMMQANRMLPNGGKMDSKKLDAMHKAFWEFMQAAWFKKLCPKCKGKRCGSCRQRGYLAKR